MEKSTSRHPVDARTSSNTQEQVRRHSTNTEEPEGWQASVRQMEERAQSNSKLSKVAALASIFSSLANPQTPLRRSQSQSSGLKRWLSTPSSISSSLLDEFEKQEISPNRSLKRSQSHSSLVKSFTADQPSENLPPSVERKSSAFLVSEGSDSLKSLLRNARQAETLIDTTNSGINSTHKKLVHSESTQQHSASQQKDNETKRGSVAEEVPKTTFGQADHLLTDAFRDSPKGTKDQLVGVSLPSKQSANPNQDLLRKLKKGFVLYIKQTAINGECFAH
jgi:hypothetical protein